MTVGAGAAADERRHHQHRRRLARALDSDLLYSFRRSPVAVLSAAIALVLILSALLAPWIAPHDPIDLASLSLARQFQAAGADGRLRLVQSARHRQPGPRRAVGDHVRHAHQPAGRLLLASSSRSCSASASACSPAIVGGMIDALLMRVADVQLTFPAILTALLVDGVIGAALPPHDARRNADLRHRVRHRHQPVARHRAHRARLDAGRAQQGLRAWRRG